MNDRGSMLYVTTTKYHSAIKTKYWRMLQCGWNKKALRSVEEARHNRSRTVCFHSREVSRAGESLDTESSVGVAKGRGRNREWLLSGRGLLLGCWQPRLAWVLAEAVVVHHCKCTPCRRPGPSRWLISCHVDFMPREFHLNLKIRNLGDFPRGPVAKTPCSQRRGLGLIPGQGTRSHMPQLRPSTAK